MSNYKAFTTGCVLLALASLSGCAHVERVGFDNTQHSVRYCGNKHADEEDVESAARDDCRPPSRLAVLSCNREQVGAKTGTIGNEGFAFSNTSATFGVCCEFTCGN